MAPTVLQIPYPRWAATANTAEYEDNWRTIERWANLARCPVEPDPGELKTGPRRVATAVPDWSQVSFRTPHPRWTDWRDAEENYLEMQRFASALAHLSTTHTCPSLQVPYKQWAREGLGAWSPAEESENLLTIQRWANAMPQCCGCIAPFIGSWSVLAGSTTLEVSGDHLTPIVDAYYIFQGEVLHRQPTTTTIIDPNPLATIIDFEYPGFELTLSGDFYLVTACGTDTFHIINN